MTDFGPPPPPPGLTVGTTPAPPPPPPLYAHTPSNQPAYVHTDGSALKHTPKSPSVLSIVILVVATVLGLIVSMTIRVQFEWAVVIGGAVSMVGFIGFAWMQDVSVGRRVWATVLAVLAIWPLSTGLVVGAWILLRRRSLVPLVVLPFAVVGVTALNIVLWNRVSGAGFSLTFLQMILSVTVFAWIAVGIDKLIKDPAVPEHPDYARPALVQVGQTPSGEPLYGYAGNPYGQATPYGFAPHTQATNSMAVLSLVFGLVGSGIIAVILGHVAHGQIRRTGERGSGMATAGLILGYLAVVVYVALLIAYGALLANSYS